MTRTFITITVLVLAIGVTFSAQTGAHESTVAPAKISKDEFSGKIFERPEVEEATDDGAATLDVTTFMSSDEKFATGEAVTIAKEWTGIVDTEGFTQIWVIYSEDGSGLE